MSQIRSVVRTVACDESISPAASLTRVDRVLTRLHDTTMATVLLARLETPATTQAARTRPGSRTLRWSSAGHLPPVLVRTDGSVQILDRASDLILGTGLFDDEAADARRAHAADLEPGDTVLLYTDGLIEVDHADIDTWLGRLAGALRPLASLSPDDLCTELLDRIAPGPTDDDIALLAVRLPRPRNSEREPTRSLSRPFNPWSESAGSRRTSDGEASPVRGIRGPTGASDACATPPRSRILPAGNRQVRCHRVPLP